MEYVARVGETSLTLATLVVKIYFKFLWPGWLLEGPVFRDYDLTGLPDSLRLIYTSSINGEREVSIETTQGSLENHETYPRAALQPVTVNGQSGVCVQGARDAAGQWQSEVDAATLEWQAGTLSYRIRHTGLGLRCNDLLRIARPAP